MLDIKLTGINYQIDENGNTTQISTAFSGYDMGENINANMVISATDLEKDTTLDDLSRKQIETEGRKKLAETVAIKDDAPEADVEPGTDNAEVKAK